MTGELPATPTTQQRRVLRGLLLLPPSLLLAGSLVMLAATPFAWNAAEVIDIPPWMPSLVALGFGGAGVAAAVYSLRSIRLRTRGDFDVFPLHLVAGTFLFLWTATTEVVLALDIAEASNYANTIDEETGESGITPVVFVLVPLIVGTLVFVLLFAAANMYHGGITNQSRRGDQRPDNVDAIGEMLRDQGSKAPSP